MFTQRFKQQIASMQPCSNNPEKSFNVAKFFYLTISTTKLFCRRRSSIVIQLKLKPQLKI